MKPKFPLRLVMYSGGQSRSNHRLHAQVARLALAARAGAKKPATGPLRLAYLPSEDEGAELFFARDAALPFGGL